VAEKAPVPDEGSSVKSADRALNLLRFVANHGPVRFSEIVDDLGLPRSSAHGLLKTMVAREWLEHDPVTRLYSLGFRAWEVGQRYAGHRDLANTAKPIMDDLAFKVGETVQLARLDGLENVYIAVSESPHPMRLASAVGMRLHAHATGLGKVLLAELDEDEARRRLSAVVLPKLTEATIVAVDDLMKELAAIRARGYALDNEEYVVGFTCVAVPVLKDGDELVAALSVTTATNRVGDSWPDEQLVHLREAAAKIRGRLGFSDPPGPA
jgi:DNA-binding IclR family transcriptional regulator